MIEIIKNKLDKMESLYVEQWKRLSEIAIFCNLDLLIDQTEKLKKTYAKIVTLKVLYDECVSHESLMNNSDNNLDFYKLIKEDLKLNYKKYCENLNNNTDLKLNYQEYFENLDNNIT